MLLAYAEMVRIRFLTMLAYRLNYISGILTYLVYIGAYYFLWQAIYAGRAKLGGLTAVQMTTYLAVSYMTRAFYFNNLDIEIADEIKTGAVAMQLLRPYHYLVGKLVSAVGEGAFRLLFWMLPGIVLASLLFPVRLPGTPQTYGLWSIAGVLAFCINAEVNAVVGLLVFFLHSSQGLMWGKRLAQDLLGGLFLPLSFYPDWLQAVLQFLPFQAIAYLPNLIFTGVLTGAAAWRALGLQLLWVVIMAVGVLLLWRRARHVLVVQGG